MPKDTIRLGTDSYLQAMTEFNAVKVGDAIRFSQPLGRSKVPANTDLQVVDRTANTLKIEVGSQVVRISRDMWFRMAGEIATDNSKRELQVGDRVRIARYEGFTARYDDKGTEGTITSIRGKSVDLNTDSGHTRCGHLSDLDLIEDHGKPTAPPAYSVLEGSEGFYSIDLGAQVMFRKSFGSVDANQWYRVSKCGRRGDVLEHFDIRGHRVPSNSSISFGAFNKLGGIVKQPSASIKAAYDALKPGDTFESLLGGRICLGEVVAAPDTTPGRLAEHVWASIGGRARPVSVYWWEEKKCRVTGSKPFSSSSEAPPAKDPFAPGEYVTCVKVGGFHGVREGEVFLVDGYHHFDKDWFCALGKIGLKAEVLGYEKSHFRPATPEEIAAYKAKHEAKELIPPQPTSVAHNSLASLTGSTVTFDGKTYILRDPVTRPTIKIAGVVYELEELVSAPSPAESNESA